MLLLAYAAYVDSGTRKRIASLTLALLLVTPLSVLAARWQWSRHLERDALNAAVVQAETTAPVPWHRLFNHCAPTSKCEWRRVIAVGTWQSEHTLLVRKQVVNGNVGFTVFTPFRTIDGITLFVLRGWVPTASASIAQAPSGQQRVILRVRTVRSSGEIQPSDLPPGQINFVDPSKMIRLVGDMDTNTSTTDGDAMSPNALVFVDSVVFELIEPVPDGLVALPWPELTSGPHVSYFVQWILIGLTGVVVYVRVFRSEVRLSRESGDDENGET